MKKHEIYTFTEVVQENVASKINVCDLTKRMCLMKLGQSDFPRASICINVNRPNFLYSLISRSYNSLSHWSYYSYSTLALT